MEDRAIAEKIFWGICWKIKLLSARLKYLPDELKPLKKYLADKYFCNFSIFQSVPDSWAIDHVFPIVPLQRLHEEPTREATLQDITCDSDGEIDNFIGINRRENTLRVHQLSSGEPYRIGIFLIGAYQEILGDLHNLFGDTNAIHIDLHEDGTWRFKNLIEGDTIKEVLHYMQYDEEQFRSQLHELTENGIIKHLISNEEALMIKKKYKTSFENYTYLLV